MDSLSVLAYFNFLNPSDYAVEAEWEWEDGSSFSWTNWLDGQPSDSEDDTTTQDCVAARRSDAAWVDNDCTNTKEFICQTAEKGTTTSTVAASAACSCDTDWVGNIDTGKCYKGSGDTKLSYTDAVAACQVRV